MHGRLKHVFMVAAAMGLAFLSRSPASAQPSVAFQIKPDHSGATAFSTGFRLPLQRVWTYSPPSPNGYLSYVSFPLIVDGMVFFIQILPPTSAYATKVVALSLRT